MSDWRFHRRFHHRDALTIAFPFAATYRTSLGIFIFRQPSPSPLFPKGSFSLAIMYARSLAFVSTFLLPSVTPLPHPFYPVAVCFSFPNRIPPFFGIYSSMKRHCPLQIVMIWDTTLSLDSITCPSLSYSPRVSVLYPSEPEKDLISRAAWRCKLKIGSMALERFEGPQWYLTTFRFRERAR